MSDRWWSKYVAPVLMFLVLASLVVGDDLRQRRALRDTCRDVNAARALQNISNDNTRAFLSVAADTRRKQADQETGKEAARDRAVANLYQALADSYPHVRLRPCPALLPFEASTPPPKEHRRPLPKLPS